MAQILGLDLKVDTVPDATTNLRFRHLQEEKNLSACMLRLVNSILTKRGLMVRCGTVVDATLIAAPSATKSKIPEGTVMPGVIVYDLTKPDMPVIARIDMPIVGEEVVEAHHGNFTQDGKLFMILNRGPGNDSRGRELAFIDAKTKKLVHRVNTASNGIGHSYNSPDGKLAVVKTIETGAGTAGGGQILNVWTNIFEELPR